MLQTRCRTIEINGYICEKTDGRMLGCLKNLMSKYYGTLGTDTLDFFQYYTTRL